MKDEFIQYRVECKGTIKECNIRYIDHPLNGLGLNLVIDTDKYGQMSYIDEDLLLYTKYISNGGTLNTGEEINILLYNLLIVLEVNNIRSLVGQDCRVVVEHFGFKKIKVHKQIIGISHSYKENHLLRANIVSKIDLSV